MLCFVDCTWFKVICKGSREKGSRDSIWLRGEVYGAVMLPDGTKINGKIICDVLYDPAQSILMKLQFQQECPR